MADKVSTDRLNDGERRILRLLAEGHTAKSIAGALDLSVNAVNERLREARRKTGAASSRELARALHTQENRDKQIGMSPAAPTDADALPPRGAISAHGLDQRSVFAMIVLAIAAIGAFALTQTTAPMSTGEPGTRIEGPVRITVQDDGSSVLQREVSPEERIKREGVDTAWAPATERQLRSIYGSIAGYRVADVHCATTVCKLDLNSIPGKSGDLMSQMASSSNHKKFVAAGVQMRSFMVKAAEPGSDDRRYTLWMVRDAHS